MLGHRLQRAASSDFPHLAGEDLDDPTDGGGLGHCCMDPLFVNPEGFWGGGRLRRTRSLAEGANFPSCAHCWVTPGEFAGRSIARWLVALLGHGGKTPGEFAGRSSARGLVGLVWSILLFEDPCNRVRAGSSGGKNVSLPEDLQSLTLAASSIGAWRRWLCPVVCKV
jgi:hypothetical protein